MRITCPYCGERDLREFTCHGGAEALSRPSGEEDMPLWDAYLHLRENAAGPSRELWQHSGGCRAWLVLHRDTQSHQIFSVVPARDRAT